MDRYGSFPGLKATPSAALVTGGIAAAVEDLWFQDQTSLVIHPDPSVTRSTGDAALRLRMRLAGVSETRSTGNVPTLSMMLRLSGVSTTRSTGTATLRVSGQGFTVLPSITRSSGSARLRLVTLGQRLSRAHTTLETTELSARVVR